MFLLYCDFDLYSELGARQAVASLVIYSEVFVLLHDFDVLRKEVGNDILFCFRILALLFHAGYCHICPMSDKFLQKIPSIPSKYIVN